jgi:hypothetical protein
VEYNFGVRIKLMDTLDENIRKKKKVKNDFFN